MKATSVKVGEGDSVRITTLAYPEDVIAGKIDKVYNMLDEESKTMSVRVKLDNRDYKLKPGMFTQVRVCGQGRAREQLCVPSHALVFEEQPLLCGYGGIGRPFGGEKKWRCTCTRMRSATYPLG